MFPSCYISITLVIVVIIVVLRKAESREPSPEAKPYHEDATRLETMPSGDVPATDAVVDDEGYFHLPEPPDLGTFMAPHISPPADSVQQLPGDSQLEAESVCVDTIKSDTTVNF